MEKKYHLFEKKNDCSEANDSKTDLYEKDLYQQHVLDTELDYHFTESDDNNHHHDRVPKQFLIDSHHNENEKTYIQKQEA